MAGVLKAEWVPGHIDYEGRAKVSQYFDSRVVPGKNGGLIGFFRGRELAGKPLQVPDGYCTSLIKMEDGKIREVQAIEPIRVWDVNVPSLDATMQVIDAIEVGRILAED
jgi:hypothetical protein